MDRPAILKFLMLGKRKGKDEVLNFLRWAKQFLFTHFEPQQFMNDGNNVIVKGFFTGKSNSTGKAFESEWVMIWEVENEKVKTTPFIRHH